MIKKFRLFLIEVRLRVLREGMYSAFRVDPAAYYRMLYSYDELRGRRAKLMGEK